VASGNKLLIGGIGVALLALLPLVVERDDILTLLFLIFLYITLSQSWNVLGGYAGQVNLGHAAFFGLGALTTRLLWVFGIPFLLALLAGGAAALLFAIIIGVPAFRLRGDYFVIGTLAMAEILRITVGNVLPQVTALPAEYLAVYDLVPRYYLALVLAVATVMTVYVMSNSRLGLGMMAVREDEDTAEASGVNTLGSKLSALGISTFFAGLAGGTFAFFHASYYYSHPFSPLWTFDALFMTYIGGVGTIVGPIVGAAFFVVLKEAFALMLPVEIHVLVFGAIFILIVLFLPGGLVEMVGRTRRLLTHARRRSP
jgi:branched-chain amino acid transport system permease protein